MSIDRRRLAARALSAAALLVILTFLARTSADADLWGHLAFGRDIVRMGAVHAGDPYSFTSDQAWVNHEWLAEIVMWLAWTWGGAPGIVALKLALASVAGVLLMATWRRAGVQPPARDVLLFATALGSWPLLATMRPQVFSIALFAVLLFVLERVRSGRRAWAWWLPPLFAVWVNTHGGWLVGAGVLVIAAAADVVRPELTARRRAGFAAACAAAAAATFCNPYGTAMLGFLADTVRPDRGDILEWRAVTELPTIAMVLWAVPVTLAVVGAWRTRVAARCAGRPLLSLLPASSVLAVVALGLGSFRVARLVGFLALAVGFHFVPAGWKGDAPDLTAPPEGRCVAARTGLPWRARGASAAAAWITLVAVAIGIAGREIRMDGPWFPEPEAAAFVTSRGLSGRMLTWFDYGEYAIWHFAPAIRVSMDGRRETVYSERMRALNFAAYDGGRTGVEAVARIAPDYVWLPTTSPGLATLAANGWHTVFRGSRSTILARAALAPAVVVASATSARSFPGP